MSNSRNAAGFRGIKQISVDSLLTCLRAATRDEYDRLEREVDVFACIATVDGYANLLKRYYGIYIPLEKQLQTLSIPVEYLTLFADGNSHTRRLKRDLAALGVASADIAALPLCGDIPCIDAPASAVGCLYVIEGSALGGQLMARYAARAHHIDMDTGASFFYGEGEETGLRWRNFCAALEESGQHMSEQEYVESARAAIDTFRAFRRWLRS